MFYIIDPNLNEQTVAIAICNNLPEAKQFVEDYIADGGERDYLTIAAPIE